MEVPLGRTYGAHAILALCLVVIPVLFLLVKLGRMEFGSVQALGMLIGLFAAIPAALFAAYSALAAIITVLRRGRVHPDMLLLPAGFSIGVVGGMGLAAIESRFWIVVAYVLVAGYVIMALALVVRHRRSARL